MGMMSEAQTVNEIVFHAVLKELDDMIAEYKKCVQLLAEAYDEDWPNGVDSLREWLLGPMAGLVMEITFWDNDVWQDLLKDL